MIALLIAAAPALLIGAGDAGCPAPVLEEALRARLPGVQIAGVPSGGDDLVATLRPEAGAFLFEVRRPAGELALQRRLEGECRIAAETAALVVDRYLDEIHWAGRPASIEPLPARPLPPAPPLEPLPEAPRRLEVSAGPAAWLGAPSDVRAGALLSATLRLDGPWEASLLAMGAASSSRAWLVEGQQRGNISVRQAALALSGAACAEPSGVRLCAGPTAGVRASIGSADGSVRQGGSETLWEPEVGVHARAGVRTGSRLLLGLQIIATATLGSASFAVAGSDAGRSLSRLDVVTALSLSVSPF